MKKSRFSDAQIVGVLQEHERGAKVPDLCRKHGITEPTFYRGKRKYGGLEVSETKRLKVLEEENRRLKQLVAEQALDNRVLKELLGKPW
ncbi:transposase [Gemmatimonadetes bacterium T265]|nr:transposase [Gemmatimonadetes bacterium T265]